MSEPLVVIGNGMAAARFADELSKRALGRYAVAVVGEEPRLAYNRVLLSSVLAGEVASSEIELKPHGWWRDRGITLRYGCRATAIDTHARSVTLADGESLAFSKLVFATGSQPIRPALPGMALPGVITFRDINDIWTIWHRAGAGDRVVVIGGGLLGLEAAYGLAKAGARVTVLHLMDRLMERQLDPQAARMLQRAVEAMGIEVVLNADTAEIARHGRVEGVDAEGRPHHRGRRRRGRDRHPPERRSRARRRHRGQSRHRGRRRARNGRRRHPRDRRMRRASRRLLRPGRAGARAGARAGRPARRARRALCRQRALDQSEGLRRQRVLGRRFPRARTAPRRSCSPIPASASTRSSSSRTAASSARCCSAIPRTGSGIST